MKTKKWNRFFALILVIMLVVMTGCSSSGGDSSKAASDDTDDSVNTESNDVDTADSDDNVDADTQTSTDSDEADAESGMGEEVTMILGFDTPTLDPFYGQSGGLKYCYSTLYETLGIMDQRGEEMTLVLAKSCEEVGDCEYEIEIWDNIYDTAGNHITAEDIVWCYETAEASAVFGNFLGSFDHMEQTGEYTLNLYLTFETVGALVNMFEGVPIVSKAGYEADPDSYITDPKGTTGYVVTSFEEGYGFTLEFIGNWHEEDQPGSLSNSANVKKINYIYISESSQVRMALENGDADIAYSLTADDLAAFRDSDNFEVYQDIENRVTQVLFNCSEKSPTNDVHLRKAIAYAINREEINDFVYGGDAVHPNAIAGVSLLDYNPEWDNEDYFEFDVDKAKEELEQASYDGETLTLLTTVSSDNKKAAELIVTYLAAIGVNCTVNAVEDSVIDSNAENETGWDLFLNPRGSEDYIVNMWTHWCPASRFNGKTQSFVDDDTLQDYYAKMLDASTHTQELVDEAIAYVNENMYVYGLYQAPSYCVYNSDKISEIFMNYKVYPLPNAFTYNY